MFRNPLARTRTAAPSRRRGRRLQVEPLEGRAMLAAGALDTSFGGTGQVITGLSQETYSYGLAVQPDLKTVVVGLQQVVNNVSPNFNVTLFRYNVNGSLDATFGNGGEVVLATNSGSFGINPAAVALQADGKIVVATNTATFVNGNGLNSCDMLVLRFNSNGSLDSTFGQNGETDIHLPQGMSESSAVAVLASGQIVVAGTNPSVAIGPEFVAARLTSSGALDTTFGPNGQGYNYTTILPSTSLADKVNSLGVDASGNILVGGFWLASSSGPAYEQVVRYTPSGLIDTSFANQGVLDLPGNAGGVTGIGFQSSGQIVLEFYPANAGGRLTRLNPNGTVDTSFGSNGYFSDPTVSGGLARLAVQPDDKILVEANGTNGGAVVDRLLAGGTLDPSFGTGGRATILGPDGLGGIVVGPDGKITGTSLASAPPSGVGPETFRLLGDAPITGQVAVTQQPPATLTAGTPFGLTTQVDDSSGSIESSYNGPVTVVLANNPGGATLGGTLTVNATNGVATFSGLSLTTAASGYTVDVTGPSLGDSLTSAITVTPSAPTQVAITQQPPTSVTAGSGFGLQAAIEDAYGNVVTTESGTVSIALASNPGGTALGGTITAATSNGVATFSGLTLTKAASGYTLSVASSGLTGSTTAALDVTPAAATQLVITQQPPTSVALNAGFGLIVVIEDAYGNVVTSANNTVTLALGNNPGGAKLGGTVSVKAKNGVATFSGLTLNKRGSGYTIKASSTGLAGVTTSAINVT